MKKLNVQKMNEDGWKTKAESQKTLDASRINTSINKVIAVVTGLIDQLSKGSKDNQLILKELSQVLKEVSKIPQPPKEWEFKVINDRHGNLDRVRARVMK